MKTKQSEIREVELLYSCEMGKIGSRGFFHMWSHEATFVDGRIHARTLALIELTDGKVHFAHPDVFKFVVPMASRPNHEQQKTRS